MTGEPVAATGALGWTAAYLAGAGPAPEPSTPAERGDMVRQVVDLLRAFPGDPAARWCADGFEAWLTAGGRLDDRLGLKARRGGAYEVPARALPLLRRDEALRELAATLPDANKSSALAAMKRDRHPLILRIEVDSCDVPRSTAQIKRILRSAAEG